MTDKMEASDACSVNESLVCSGTKVASPHLSSSSSTASTCDLNSSQSSNNTLDVSKATIDSSAFPPAASLSSCSSLKQNSMQHIAVPDTFPVPSDHMPITFIPSDSSQPDLTLKFKMKAKIPSRGSRRLKKSIISPLAVRTSLHSSSSHSSFILDRHCVRSPVKRYGGLPACTSIILRRKRRLSGYSQYSSSASETPKFISCRHSPRINQRSRNHVRDCLSPLPETPHSTLQTSRKILH
ncbi:unnamed protein product [Protopolystoma xenopodis]|uniref:Uncharacterized protein n=1 Tax=Protopolystoma xenopodis TaxID=117903 RepID=A0A448X775_9PLAT|nr:unnamed protein product [Protopolystoma xenopodis]